MTHREVWTMSYASRQAGSFLAASLMAFAWVPSVGCAQSSRVAIRVYLPTGTPTAERITVAGNHPLLGIWDPSVRDLRRTSDTTVEASFDIENGLRLEFKVTRGTWDTEAIFSPTGEVPPNTVVTVGGDTTIILTPVGWRDSMPRIATSLTGDARVFPNLAGDGLRYARSVTVRLPPSYATDTARLYPVLYVHDGQNCLDRATAAFGAEWRVDEIMDSLSQAGAIDEAIIVAINNTSDRMEEYSDSPKGAAYAMFVVTKVKPMIDSLYRTMPGPEQTGVMGSSLGGLISFLFTWWHPDVFGKAGCLSSVFDRQRTRVLEMVEAEQGRRAAFRVYMDCGVAPGEVSLKPGIEEMVHVLSGKGYEQGRNVVSYFDPQAEHDERAWAARLWRPLRFLFGRTP